LRGGSGEVVFVDVDIIVAVCFSCSSRLISGAGRRGVGIDLDLAGAAFDVFVEFFDLAFGRFGVGVPSGLPACLGLA
jgi:hypothetical protein